MVAPVAINVPPHETVYHDHLAEEPNIPPEIFNVTEFPGQSDEGVAITPDGARDVTFTLTVTLKHIVVLHVPSALNQYVVVVEGLLKIEIPDPEIVTPQDELYQIQLAFVPNKPPVPDKVTEVPEHINVWLDITETGAIEFELTVIVVLTQEVVLLNPSARR
jgi:hypothetical protein